MAKAEKLYKDSPKLERDEESGKVEAKKPSEKAKDTAEGSAGTDGMEVTERHAAELHETHKRHQSELADMHERHAKDLKAVHARHEKEAGTGEKPAEKK